MKEGSGIRVYRGGTIPTVWTMDIVRGRCLEQGDCLIWMNGVNSAGYPTTSINSVPGTSVRRHIFTEILGKKVRKGYRVSTKCLNKLCCSDKCLIAVSVSKLVARAYEKRKEEPTFLQRLQDRCAFAKLDRETAREVRNAPGTVRERAKRFGISDTSARAIIKGEAWVESHIPNSVFNLAQAMGAA